MTRASAAHAASRSSRLLNNLLQSPVGFCFCIYCQIQFWNCTLALELIMHSRTPGTFFKLVSLRSHWYSVCQCIV